MIGEVISAAVVWLLVVLAGFLVVRLRRGRRQRRGTRPEPRTPRRHRLDKPEQQVSRRRRRPRVQCAGRGDRSASMARGEQAPAEGRAGSGLEAAGRHYTTT